MTIPFLHLLHANSGNIATAAYTNKQRRRRRCRRNNSHFHFHQFFIILLSTLLAHGNNAIASKRSGSDIRSRPDKRSTSDNCMNRCILCRLYCLFPQSIRISFQALLAPGAEFEFQRDDDSVRSSCPAINTLANHGFINRDGRDVKLKDLAQALEDVYRVSVVFLTNGGIRSVIDLELTDVDDDGDATITLDSFFRNAPVGKEHDSSFIRQDFGQRGIDDMEPSPELIKLFFDSTTREILQTHEIMEYQRNRIQNSCDRQVEGEERVYTPGQRGGMALQGSFLFIAAQQAKQKIPFLQLNKANLRSILEHETLPNNFNPDANHFFDFADGTQEKDNLIAFRNNVEEAICNYCSADQCSENNP